MCDEVRSARSLSLTPPDISRIETRGAVLSHGERRRQRYLRETHWSTWVTA
jgi:hypothetical protein